MLQVHFSNVLQRAHLHSKATSRAAPGVILVSGYSDLQEVPVRNRPRFKTFIGLARAEP